MTLSTKVDSTVFLSCFRDFFCQGVGLTLDAPAKSPSLPFAATNLKMQILFLGSAPEAL